MPSWSKSLSSQILPRMSTGRALFKRKGLTRAPVILSLIGDRESKTLSNWMREEALMYQGSSGDMRDVMLEERAPSSGAGVGK